MKRILLLSLLALLTLTACSGEQTKSANAPKSTEVSFGSAAGKLPADNRTSDNTSPNTDTPTSSTPKIIKNGSVSIESRRLEESKKDIDLLVKKFGAYYEAESVENQPGHRSYNLTLRVPDNRFDSLLRELDQIEDKVISKNISTEDITTQYIDVQTRLKSKRTYLNRYQDMAKSASSVKELLEIEEQIQKLQEDIESTENMMRSLDDQIDYWTLRVYLIDHQANINQTKDGFFRRAIEAVANGWHLIEHIAITAITLWPIWLIVASVVLVVHRVRMRRQNKDRSDKP